MLEAKLEAELEAWKLLRQVLEVERGAWLAERVRQISKMTRGAVLATWETWDSEQQAEQQAWEELLKAGQKAWETKWKALEVGGTWEAWGTGMVLREACDAERQALEAERQAWKERQQAWKALLKAGKTEQQEEWEAYRTLDVRQIVRGFVRDVGQGVWRAWEAEKEKQSWEAEREAKGAQRGAILEVWDEIQKAREAGDAERRAWDAVQRAWDAWNRVRREGERIRAFDEAN